MKWVCFQDKLDKNCRGTYNSNMHGIEELKDVYRYC